MISFDKIAIAMGNGYMTLSQLQRMVNAITDAKENVVKPCSSPRLSIRVFQPLVFDNLTFNSTLITVVDDASSPSSSSSRQHLKVKDDYIVQ
jgi:hypothetical protein